jgi:hypothetical protein
MAAARLRPTRVVEGVYTDDQFERLLDVIRTRGVTRHLAPPRPSRS